MPVIGIKLSLITKRRLHLCGSLHKFGRFRAEFALCSRGFHSYQRSLGKHGGQLGLRNSGIGYRIFQALL